jgi:16S rRNA (cytosine1402-N4)-methyltransferase
MTDLHKPVLVNEIVETFQEQKLKPQIFLDGTFGRGGHTKVLLENFPDARVFGFDRDEQAHRYAEKAFSTEISQGRLKIIHDDFRSLNSHKIGPFDGAIFDLGVSSPQFDESERGFSFQNDGPLDMRMDQNQATTAAEIVNTSTEKELSDIFFNLGDVRHPNRVVRAIVHDRDENPFTRTRQLASLIERVERAGKSHSRSKERIHPATSYFMALRIAVNNELENLKEFFESFPENLKDGARVAVISFHSLEDRIVKWTFRGLDKKVGHIINKKVIIAGEEELDRNPRSRSAKLRIFEKETLS